MTRSEDAPDSAPVLRAGDAAELVNGRLRGDPDRTIRGVAPIVQAGPEELGLLASRRYLRYLSGSSAGALLVSEDLEKAVSEDDASPETRIVVEDAHRALVPLLRRLHPAEPEAVGIHPTAVLGSGVTLGRDVCIGPYSVIGDGAVLGDEIRIGAHVTVGRDCRIGAGSVLHPQVVLYPETVLGERVILHAGVRIGVDGFGYTTVDGEHRKIPQVGACVIEDDVEIGANCTLDRGSIGRTVVRRGTKLDNLVHLGHNVEVGERSMLVAQVGIAGSTRMGREVVCGGQSGVVGHVEIGDGARIGAQAGVIGDVEEGRTVSGFPARDHREFLRGMAMVMKLPELRARVRELERRLDDRQDRADGEGVERDEGES